MTENAQLTPVSFQDELSEIRTFKKRSGFSLIEILIVIALIAALAGVVIANLEGLLGGGQQEIAKIFVNETIKTPLMVYRLNVGSYPTSEQGLNALVTAPGNTASKWKGPYVEDLPADPWGNPYQYRYPGTRNTGKYDVWSLGPDGQESADDIGNWK